MIAKHVKAEQKNAQVQVVRKMGRSWTQPESPLVNVVSTLML